MTKSRKFLSFDDAVYPPIEGARPDVKAWQAEKIRAGVMDADAGRFATHEAVKAVIEKFIPNG